jgi:hypothetical protein
LIPASMTVRLIGLSLVNDPLDLGNTPLHQTHQVKYHQPTGGSRFVTLSETRFEAIWPIADSYDVREFLGLLGIETAIGDLLKGSRILNEVSAPINAVLKTRESRGQTAEREFMKYLDSLNAPESSTVRGAGRDLRLGRMLRDANLLKYAQGTGISGSGAEYPSFGSGSYAMPNPGLAWALSGKSRGGLRSAVALDLVEKSRYQREIDTARVYVSFMKSCNTNITCVLRP